MGLIRHCSVCRRKHRKQGVNGRGSWYPTGSNTVGRCHLTRHGRCSCDHDGARKDHFQLFRGSRDRRVIGGRRAGAALRWSRTDHDAVDAICTQHGAWRGRGRRGCSGWGWGAGVVVVEPGLVHRGVRFRHRELVPAQAPGFDLGRRRHLRPVPRQQRMRNQPLSQSCWLGQRVPLQYGLIAALLPRLHDD